MQEKNQITKNQDYYVQEIAQAVDREIQELPVKNTPNLRKIRRKYSTTLKNANPGFVLDLARVLFKEYGYRWIAYELIRFHKEAFERIGEAELIEFCTGISSWGEVDAFGGLMSGPAWQQGQITDRLIQKWTCSKNRWWRRAALVSTVALNRKSLGGKGDVQRTLKICQLLIADYDDMIVKALSWALRELVVHDSHAVRKFLDEHSGILASRVTREVKNKLNTGLKNPGRKGK
jgi:3-methyladenine DNA glycosylase AlkD